MTMISYIWLSVATACGGVLAAEYSSYPDSFDNHFENEVSVPPYWSGGGDSVPDMSFTQDDPGGYIDYYGWKMSWYEGGTLRESDFPYSQWQNGYGMFLMVVQYESSPLDDLSIYNCTKNDAFFSASDFTGIVAGERICDVGSCCSDSYTFPMYSDDTLSYESWITDRVTGSVCDTPIEEVYCSYVMGDSHNCCWEFRMTLLERPYVMGCYDTQYLFNLNCKVFQVEFPVPYKKEPTSYYDKLSNVETISMEAFHNLQDRICHTYSYYVPVTNTPASDTSTSDTPTSDTPTSSDESSSSAWISFVYSTAAIAMII